MLPTALENRFAELQIQADVNASRPKRHQPFDFLDQEEEARIRQLIELKTFPDRWTGDEPNGAELLDQIFSDGSIQPVLF